MGEIVAVSAIALDDVKTPIGEVRGALGGPLAYFSYGASFFSRVNMVSIIGSDFPAEHMKLFGDRGLNMDGVQTADGRTFRWGAYYEKEMSQAFTTFTELNVFENFRPDLPEHYRDHEYVFLGNIQPSLQGHVLDQMRGPRFVGLDTMNYWITRNREELIEAIRRVDALFLNDAEIRMLFGTHNIVKAAKAALALGPRAVIIKKGEHGSLLVTEHSHFSAPAYPLENLVDPTGAGDSFAGGFMGWLARTDDLSEANMRKAVIYGSVVASFNAEGFSLDNLKRITLDDIEKRFEEFKRIASF